MRFRWILLAMLLASVPAPAHAEWQLRPFVGLTFGGDSTFVWTERKPNIAMGVSGGLIGEVIGIEGDISFGPGFYDGDKKLVLGSSVTTFTGNVTIGLPRSMTEYTLRPYFVGGAGLMRLHVEDTLQVLPVSESLAAMDLGGGVTGFLSSRLGVNWDVRYFRSLGGNTVQGLSFGPEKLSFWRATMALAIRY